MSRSGSPAQTSDNARKEKPPEGKLVEGTELVGAKLFN
jgi:hypothetical protein